MESSSSSGNIRRPVVLGSTSRGATVSGSDNNNRKPRQTPLPRARDESRQRLHASAKEAADLLAKSAKVGVGSSSRPASHERPLPQEEPAVQEDPWGLHALREEKDRQRAEEAKQAAAKAWKGRPWEVQAFLRKWIDDAKNSNEAFIELKALFAAGEDAEPRMARALAKVQVRAGRGSDEVLRDLVDRVIALFVLSTGLPLAAYAEGAEPIELELDPMPPERNPHPRAPKVEQDLYKEKMQRAKRHQKLQRDDDVFVTGLLDDFLAHPAKDDTEKLVVMTLAHAPIPYERLTAALDRAARGNAEHAALANKLYSELVYTDRKLKKTGEPMSGCDRFYAFLRIVGNGVREGACHGAARFIIEWMLAMVPGAHMPVLILSTAIFPLLGYAHINGLKSPAYRAQPSMLINSLLGSAGLIAGGMGIVLATLLYLQLIPASMAITLMAAGSVRVLREFFQTGTDQHWTAGLDWSRPDGRPVSARDQFHTNLLRDTIYTVLSIAAALLGPAWVQGYLDELRSMPGDPADEAWRIFISLLPATVNELLDGIFPDLSKAFMAWMKGLRVFDGTRSFPGLSSQPFMKRASARLLLNTPADAFFMVAALLRKEGFKNEAYLFTVLGGLMAGLLGAMRARSANYVTTEETVEENGMLNPDGLFYWMCAGIGSCARGVGNGLSAMAGYAGAVAGAVQPGAAQAAVQQVAQMNIPVKPPVKGTGREKPVLEDVVIDRPSLRKSTDVFELVGGPPPGIPIQADHPDDVLPPRTDSRRRINAKGIGGKSAKPSGGKGPYGKTRKKM